MTTPAQRAHEERLRHERERKAEQKTTGRMIAARRRARRKIDREGRCRVCGARDPEWHHILPRSRFGSGDATKHHPDNAMPLCLECHTHHHTTAHRRVPRHKLTPDELAFAIRHAGPAWVDRWYPTTDRTT